MKSLSIAIVSFSLASCGVKIETNVESNAVATVVEYNGSPLLYLANEIEEKNLKGASFESVFSSLDPQKLKLNERNIKKGSDSYYLVYPDDTYILVELTQNTISKIENHGANGTGPMMEEILKKLESEPPIGGNSQP